MRQATIRVRLRRSTQYVIAPFNTPKPNHDHMSSNVVMLTIQSEGLIYLHTAQRGGRRSICMHERIIASEASSSSNVYGRQRTQSDRCQQDIYMRINRFLRHIQGAIRTNERDKKSRCDMRQE